MKMNSACWKLKKISFESHQLLQKHFKLKIGYDDDDDFKDFLGLKGVVHPKSTQP